MTKPRLFIAALLSLIQLTSMPAYGERGIKVIRDLNHQNDTVGTYRALIIGIDEYRDEKIPDLQTAVNDAEEMAKLLTMQYGFTAELLLNQEATRKAIYMSLRNLVTASKSDDSVLIYYAGHGDLDRTFNDGWWIPEDAKGGDPMTYLDNSLIQKTMNSMKARHVLLISDACFSGTLFGERSRGIPKMIDNDYYLSLYNEKSRWGMTSGNNTPVADSGTEGHSIFAYQLLKNLKENKKPYISTQEIYTHIAPIISNNSDQTPLCRPIENTGDQGGEFIFISTKTTYAKTASPSIKLSKINPKGSSNKPTATSANLKTTTNSLGMTFVYIKPGSFLMGSPEYENGRNLDETQHQVILTKGFYLGQTEVTIGQWREFVKKTSYKTEAEIQNERISDKSRIEPLGQMTDIIGKEKDTDENYWDKPGFFQNDNSPVTCISFNDVQEFITWLSQKEEKTYRLPTEAEWEYANRVGNKMTQFQDNDLTNACTYSNIADTFLTKALSISTDYNCEDGFVYTAPVAQFAPNGFGIYDMTGNVSEWCQDKYGSYLNKRTIIHGMPINFHKKGPIIDPQGTESGSSHVIRGGTWISPPKKSRTASREKNKAAFRKNTLGFRLVEEI